jgi:hypothetical protein
MFLLGIREYSEKSLLSFGECVPVTLPRHLLSFTQPTSSIYITAIARKATALQKPIDQCS